MVWKFYEAELEVLYVRCGEEKTFICFLTSSELGVTFNAKTPSEGKLHFASNYLITPLLVLHVSFSPHITPHVIYKDIYFSIDYEFVILTQRTS
jgi:hypothetical protein